MSVSVCAAQDLQVALSQIGTPIAKPPSTPQVWRGLLMPGVRGEYYTEALQQWTWYTWPSLVDHRHSPSLIPGRTARRHAARFIGTTRSALELTWDGRVAPIDVTRPPRHDRNAQRQRSTSWRSSAMSDVADSQETTPEAPREGDQPTQETATASKPRVSAGNVAELFRTRGNHKHILLIQEALAAEVGLDYSPGPGDAGPRTRRAYADWQRRCGVPNRDGIPDKDSLKALGDTHGWITTK